MSGKNSKLTLDYITKTCKIMSKNQGFDDNLPRRTMKLQSEVGELAEEIMYFCDLPIFCDCGNLNCDCVGTLKATGKELIGKEVFDVVCNAMEILRILNIDANTLFAERIKINEGVNYES